jgi:hypothetical protein
VVSEAEIEYDFFLVHAGGDTRQAEKLFDLLSLRARVFLASRSLLPGDRWDGTVPDAQRRSRVTVVLVSRHTDAAFYQREEIAAGIDQARRGDPPGHRVVPVYLAGRPPTIPYGLRALHSITVSGKVTLDVAATRLLDLLEHTPAPGGVVRAPRPGNRWVAVALLTALLAGALVAAAWPALLRPGRGVGWWLVVGLLAATMVLTLIALRDKWWDQVRRLLGALGQALKRIADRVVAHWLAGLTALVLVAVGAAFWLVSVSSAAVGCPVPTELPVLTTADGMASTQALAVAFEHARTGPNRCPTVHAFVYSGESAGVSTAALGAALARSWQDDQDISPFRDIGPRPAVWLPDSSLDVDRVRSLARQNLLDEARQPILPETSIAESPIVLGLLDPGAPAAMPRTAALPWAKVLQQADDEDWSLLRPGPDSSTTAALATLSMYARQVNGRLDLSHSVTDDRKVEQRISASLTGRDEHPEVTSATLLCQERSGAGRRAGHRPTYLITSEQMLNRYYWGLRISPDCAQQDPLPGTAATRIIQPVDTFIMDHPYVQFRWTSDPQAGAARDFLGWLLGPEGQDAVIAQGLRPPGAVRNPAARPRFGDVQTALSQYRSTKPPADVLLAVDGSGSMSSPAPGAAGTRFQVVTQGVRDALNQMGPQDEFALWTFPPRGTKRDRELGRIMPGGNPQRQQLADALAHAPPSGSTPLYRTIVDAVAAVGHSTATRTTAVVVFTDGEDTSSDLSAADTAGRIRAAGTTVYIIAAGDANCATGPLSVIAPRTCYQADFGSVDRVLRQLFATLWGGR